MSTSPSGQSEYESANFRPLELTTNSIAVSISDAEELHSDLPTIFAGFPTAVTQFGSAFSTNDPEPILQQFPMRMLPRIVALQPISTSFPIFGWRSPLSLPVEPSVTPCRKEQFLPMGGGRYGGGAEGTASKIYGLIMGRAKEAGHVMFDEMRETVVNAGFSEDQFRAVLQEYVDLNVLQLNSTHTRIDVVGR